MTTKPTPAPARRQAKTTAPLAPQKLKAERVELKLARLAGWSQTDSQSSLVRVFDLGSPHQAAVFAGYLAGVVSHSGGHVGISRQKVTVLLDGPAEGGLTTNEIALARDIERLMEKMTKGWGGR